MSEPLRNFDAWAKSMRNFETWIGDAVPGASDIDVLVERSGQFLVLEGKPWRRTGKFGVAMQYGQHLALTRLSELEVFTVYLVGGVDDGSELWLCPYEANTPIVRGSNVWWPRRAFVRTTPAGLRETVRAWWDSAGGRHAA